MAINLTTFSGELAAAVEAASAYVVGVQARSGPGSSGIVWRDGLILTSGEGIRVEEGIRITKPGGHVVEARLRAADAGTDLALLEADTSGVPSAPAPAPAISIRPGHLVLAVGRTAQTGPIAAFGIVSGVAGEWKSWRGGKLDPFVRLDLAAYPSQSGAALVSAEGSFLGLVSTGLSRSSVLGMTQPTIERVLERLNRAGGPASRGFLGAALQPVALPDHLKEKLGLGNQASGVMVVGLEPSGPAETGGLFLGDLLVAAGAATLDDPAALAALLDGTTAGDTVRFRLIRGGQLAEHSVTLGARPDSRRRR